MKKMTKLNFLMVIALAYTLTLSCKKDEAVVAPKLLTYNADIKSIFVANCTALPFSGRFQSK